MLLLSHQITDKVVANLWLINGIMKILVSFKRICYININVVDLTLSYIWNTLLPFFWMLLYMKDWQLSVKFACISSQQSGFDPQCCHLFRNQFLSLTHLWSKTHLLAHTHTFILSLFPFLYLSGLYISPYFSNTFSFSLTLSHFPPLSLSLSISLPLSYTHAQFSLTHSRPHFPLFSITLSLIHSLSYLFQPEEMTDIVELSKKIEDRYGHLFNATIVNEDLQTAIKELITLAARIEKEPQWVPVGWAQR